MVAKAYHMYISSFRGLRREVWFLALVTLINRAGTMVVPFLSLYLTEDLGYSLDAAGWVLTAFGCGSTLGAWIGGKLTDRWGFYPVILWSFLLSGVLFILLQFMDSIALLSAGVFVLMSVADTSRPALFVALNAYSKPENKTRNVTLIRLAINLGFSMGPAMGGLIITTIGYSGLFWIDGLTCLGAGLLFLAVLDKRKTKSVSHVTEMTEISPYRDRTFLLFIGASFLVSFAFLQYFSTIPLYYREAHHMSEDNIGLLLAMNGIVIFLLEMPLVKFFDSPGFSSIRILVVSTLMIGASFFVLNMSSASHVLITGMMLMTFGEMLNFPFMNRWAMDRAARGRSGEYMALFTMTFGLGHIFCHNAGMHLIDRYGFDVTWYIMTGALIFAAFLFVVLKWRLKNEEE
ncbi:MAG: MFS transporter [Flavobacteriales bacterium]|nr:MFS transporter [Flavobacteriales bacterium]